MKHIQPVTKRPQLAQVNPNFQAKIDFLVNLVDQMIAYFLVITR